jgi:hypothetical protein
MGLLLSLALGSSGLLIAAAVGLFLLGGWPLLLNRRVLIGLAIAAAAIAAVVWIDRTRESLIDQGRREQRAVDEAANERARVVRRDQISAQVVESSKREVAALEQLRLANQRIELARLERERKPHVTPAADARCVVPHGFVLDHDAGLSSAAGHPAVLDAKADDDRASGIPLSLASREIGRNYAELGKCINGLNAAEERRYTECLAWDRTYGTKSGCTRGGPPEAARTRGAE